MYRNFGHTVVPLPSAKSLIIPSLEIRKTYNALCNRKKGKPRIAVVDVRMLAYSAQCTTREIHSHLKWLERAGVIVRVPASNPTAYSFPRLDMSFHGKHPPSRLNRPLNRIKELTPLNS